MRTFHTEFSRPGGGTHPLRKRLAVMGLVFGLFAMFVTTASAHHLTGARANVSCQGYDLSVSAANMTIARNYLISYSFFAKCNNVTTTFPGTINFTATSGTPTVTTSGTWNLSGACTMTGKASMVADGVTSTVPITITPTSLSCVPPPPPICSTGPQALPRNVSEKGDNANQFVWFNSHFKLKGTVPTTDFTVNAINQTITFGPSTLVVPNAVIKFKSSAYCASTIFNNVTHQWETTVPLSYATQADEIFSAGLAYLLPVGFSQNVSNVTWRVTFTSTAPSLQFAFQYGAANYRATGFPAVGSQPNYNAMMIDPVHNAPTCAGYPGGNHAGTPESTIVKALVTGGGSGGGGSNWTGSWSSTPTYICAPLLSQDPTIGM